MTTPSTFDLTGKIAIVTGASRGIGAATARLAAGRGYAVCVNYRRNRAAAAAVVHDLQAAGARAIAVAADVAVEDDVVRLFETCDAALGSPVSLTCTSLTKAPPPGFPSPPTRPADRRRALSRGACR